MERKSQGKCEAAEMFCSKISLIFSFVSFTGGIERFRVSAKCFMMRKLIALTRPIQFVSGIQKCQEGN